MTIEDATQADLLFSLCYSETPGVVSRFRRTALLDIDPGQIQRYIKEGLINLTLHDFYFTIGETVGQSGVYGAGCSVAMAPRSTLHFTAALACPRGGAEAAFTTVSHWYSGEWTPDGLGGHYNNEKRAAFLPYLDLPSKVKAPLELALCLEGDEQERGSLKKKGWRVEEAWAVSATPADYQRYVQNSLGEFTCIKEHYKRMQTAWISDRSLCYLASGKPVLIQYSGPSRFLPEDAGMFRFRSLDHATGVSNLSCPIMKTSADELARRRRIFDARKAAKKVLEETLP